MAARKLLERDEHHGLTFSGVCFIWAAGLRAGRLFFCAPLDNHNLLPGGVSGGIRAPMATSAPRQKRSLLFDQPETSSDRYLRNYYLDLGLDPDNPGQALVDGGGMSSAFGRQALRTVSRGNSRTMGARQLTPEELTSAWALQERSPEQGGTFYDNMDDPRHQSVTKKFWADRVSPQRAREGGGMESVPTFEFQDDAYRQADARQLRRQIADAASRQRQVDAQNAVGYDQAVARRGGAPARTGTDAVRARVFGDFAGGEPVARGSGGTINRGGVNFDVAPGYSDVKRQAGVRRPQQFAVSGADYSGGSDNRNYDDPYAEDPNMPQTPVVDRRYKGSSMGSRTGAKALPSPVFDPFGEARNQKARFGGF